MEYRQLGSSGLRVSKLCLGAMRGFTHQKEATARQVVDAALDGGVNFIDTADVYGRGESEEVVGKILADNKKREKTVLATKFGWFMGEDTNDYGAGRKHLISACENSLRRLRTDYIDLYILHVVDPNTPMEELLYTCDILARSGKVRYFGTSKHPVSLILEGLFASEKYGYPRFVSEQPPYNLLDRTPENELIPACQKHGVGITPFFTIAGGILSGKYNDEQMMAEDSRMDRQNLDENEIFTTRSLELVEKITPLARTKGVTPAEFSLAWVMAQPGISSAILGCRKPEYIRTGLKACQLQFTTGELAEIDRIATPGRYTSNYYEANIYRQLRMHYSASARDLQGTGAYIPRTETNPDTDAK